MSNYQQFPYKWEEYPLNPVISPPFLGYMIADPTFLTPTETPDGLWHLFAHTTFWSFSVSSVIHYTSSDGIEWQRNKKIILRNNLRPYLFRSDGKYYLVTEKITSLMKGYSSQLVVRESSDLYHWDSETVILNPVLPWHKDGSAKGAISNPCIIKTGNKFRLYYSAGLSYLTDCKFYEPKYIGFADSEKIRGPYVLNNEPIITPNLNDPYLNLGSGSIKVIFYNNLYLGFQNGIYWDAQSKHSGSAIRVWSSIDGENWQLLNFEPVLKPAPGWKNGFVYANDIRFYGNQAIIYFNARSGWIFGREKIGFATSQLSR